jgi:hypothetical protein
MKRKNKLKNETNINQKKRKKQSCKKRMETNETNKGK